MSVIPPDFDPSEQHAEQPSTIFVSDPSAEADRLSAALHGEGYTVIDVPLSLLVARVAVQTPSLILLDIDAEGAHDVIARLRELPGAQGIDILFLGDAGKTLSDNVDALRQEGSGFLARPVDVQALLRTIATLIGARQERDAPSSVPSGASVRTGASGSDRFTPSSNRSTRSPLPEAWSESSGPIPRDDTLEPAFGRGTSPPALALPALSSEVEKLLQRAEERSEQDEGPGSLIAAMDPPSPDEEIDAVLPADVLAALDEPLDEIDDDLESDSGLSTSIPRRAVRTPEVVTSSGHPPGPTGSDEHAASGQARVEPPTPESRARPSQPPPWTGGAGDSTRAAGVDPKEIETPRPPRRGAGSAAPVFSVPQSPAAPRTPRPSLPPSVSAGLAVRVPTSAGSSAIPPSSSRRGRGPSYLPATSPPSPSPDTMPPDPYMHRSVGPTPLPPRRSESGLVPDPNVEATVGVAPSAMPAELGPGDALSAFAICVRERATGALCIDTPEGVRRILLRDGDVVTTASGLDGESLVGFLGSRGDISADVAAQLIGKIPAYGRHAGAALVANGHIGQDQLWPVLRAHAEWILSCAVCVDRGAASFEVTPPGRLRAEPSVFGGATGSEVLIEVVRRAVPAEVALSRLGGPGAHLSEGPRWELLAECALAEGEQQWLGRAKGATLDDALPRWSSEDLAPVVYALVQLGVLAVETPGMKPRQRKANPRARFDALDAEAVRSQVKARLSLVEEGDYFSLLGVPRTATAYEIHRAYLELRRGLEPSLVLNAATADLADDIDLIIEVLDEAHDVLRDQSRRERYRRAIEEKPPT